MSDSDTAATLEAAAATIDAGPAQYAVIEDSGTQIKVSEGDVIMVSIRDLEDEKAITFDKVMMIGKAGDEPQIGAPYVNGASVTGEVLERGRTKRVDVVKFKRRKGYKRRRGHRQDYLKVKVTSISA